MVAVAAAAELDKGVPTALCCGVGVGCAGSGFWLVGVALEPAAAQFFGVALYVYAADAAVGLDAAGDGLYGGAAGVVAHTC